MTFMTIKGRLVKAVGVIVSVLLVISLFPLSAFAVESQTTPSGIEYSQLESKLNEFIESHQDSAASVSLALFDNNETLYTVRNGYSHIKNQVPADENTVYEWGSCSKLLVWVSVMQLEEQGRIDLQRDIRQYLPKGFLSKLRFDNPITIIDLMNHKGGWQETTDPIFYENAERLTSLEDALRNSEPSQVFEPGTITAYSNWGTTLAAYIVERVSGMDYAAYVHEKIFVPLDMNQTSLKGDFTDNTWVKNQREQLDYLDMLGSVSSEKYYINMYPAGSATGTLDDFVKFAKAFVPVPSEKSPLFSHSQTLERMLSPTSVYSGTDVARICHGFWTMEFGVSVMGHGGNTLGFSSNLMFDPQSGLGVVVMSNKYNETDYSYGLLPIIFGRCESGNITGSSDISGIYLNKRTVEKGFLRISKYLTLMPIMGPDDDGKYSLFNGLTTTPMTRVSETLYLIDMGVGMETLVNVIQGPNGKLVMESYTSDLERVGTFSLISVWLLLLLTVATGLYALIRSIICLVGLIRRKLTGGAAVMRMITLVSVVVIVVLLAYLWVAGSLVSSDLYYSTVMPICVAVTTLSLLPIVNIMVMIKKWQTLTKHVRYSIMAILCCIPTASVIFFEVYDFWS